MILESMAELARHMNLSTSAIYKAKREGKIRLTDGGKIDTTDPVNWEYIQGSKQSQVQRGIYHDEYDYLGKSSIESLEAEKLKADIKYKNKQSRKLDLQFEIEKKHLIPADVVGIWVGAFSNGIRNNFLQIGNRVARGDIKLRNRIEKEITKAIKKTLDTAAAQLRQETEKIIEMMGVDNEENPVPEKQQNKKTVKKKTRSKVGVK